MSEVLLKAIIHLFAIIAKEDDITEDERKTIEEFLNENLNRNAAENYLQMFDTIGAEKLKNQISHEEEVKEIQALCESVNKELTNRQKVVLILELIELILADQVVSPREEELLSEIGKAFNIQEDGITSIKKFVLGEKPEDFTSNNILIIDAEEWPDKSFQHLKRQHLSGFIAVLYLEDMDMYFVRHLGVSEIYLNGIPLRHAKTRILSTGSTIRESHIQPIFYSDIVNQFLKRRFASQLTFEARNISYRFRNGNLGIRDVSFSESSGTLIGLMGASGAGKSTLLNVLNGTDKPSEGQVLINGVDIHKQKDQIEGVIGFVPQDDLLIEDLTVYDNLYYAAKLCFGDRKQDEIDALVTRVLENLGLREIMDLKVGSPLKKTISGGQRKRLNIGLELLREPSILFVDEPTSGLSSRDSENIMDLLKELSLKGKLVFVVIHQPSSDIFKMFDKLLILDVGGYPIYYGNPVNALVYFRDIFNVVNKDQGECPECGNVNPEQIFNIIESRVVDEYGNFTKERKVDPVDWNKHFREKIKISTITHSDETPPSSLALPNLFNQLRVFISRDFFSKLSNTQYLSINLLEAPILGFLLAYSVRYFNIDDAVHTGYVFSKNINLPAYLFMSVIVALFMGLTVSAEEIIRDRKILKREAFLNLSWGSYLWSKLIILFALSAIQTFTFVLVGNYILEIKGMFLTYWAILFAVSCFANVLGLNISSAFNSAVTIYILIPILLIPQLLLSGVVVRFDKLNPHLSNESHVPVVGEIMTSRWALEAMMVSQFKENKYENMFFELDRDLANLEYYKTYYVPKLISELDYAHQNRNTQDPELIRKSEEALTTLRSEIRKELAKYGSDKFPYADDLTMEKLDESLYQRTHEFLETLKQVYSNEYNKANRKKDGLLQELTSSPEKRKQLDDLRNDFYNESVAMSVKNVSESQRIIEEKGRLVRKINPVYMELPEPDHPFDFRAQFYVAEKHFLGSYFNTFSFNLAVIWSMTILLMITLYFDLLRKLLKFFSSLSR